MQFRDRICCSHGGCLSWIEINKALFDQDWVVLSFKNVPLLFNFGTGFECMGVHGHSCEPAKHEC